MQSKHDPIHLLKKLPIWGAGKNGSVIKNSHCCYRGPKFGSQHPHFSSAGLRVSESQVQSPCYDGSAYIFLILQWRVTCTQRSVRETHTPDLNSDRSLSWWDAADHLPRCWSKAANRHPMSDKPTLHSRSCRAGQSGCYCIECIFNPPFSVHGSGFVVAVWILNIPQRSLWNSFGLQGGSIRKW